MNNFSFLINFFHNIEVDSSTPSKCLSIDLLLSGLFQTHSAQTVVLFLLHIKWIIAQG